MPALAPNMNVAGVCHDIADLESCFVVVFSPEFEFGGWYRLAYPMGIYIARARSPQVGVGLFKFPILLAVPALRHDVAPGPLPLKPHGEFLDQDFHEEMVGVALIPVGALHHLDLVDNDAEDAVFGILQVADQAQIESIAQRVVIQDLKRSLPLQYVFAVENDGARGLSENAVAESMESRRCHRVGIFDTHDHPAKAQVPVPLVMGGFQVIMSDFIDVQAIGHA